jgi:hypothetical protein
LEAAKEILSEDYEKRPHYIFAVIAFPHHGGHLVSGISILPSRKTEKVRSEKSERGISADYTGG